MTDIDELDHFQRLTAGVAAKLRGDDVYIPAPERERSERVVPGQSTELVHIDLPFWDVFVLVLKVQVSLLLISLPFAVAAYLLWS